MNIATDGRQPQLANQQPLTLLILALGGEGGSVLADWIVESAQAQGLAVQGTSVPGVAQRTGATSYYIEMLPQPLPAGSTRQPVFCLSPTPGQIDLLLSSELLETGRALEAGFANPERTQIISSSNRFLTVAEKAAQADGRYDDHLIRDAAQALSQGASFIDMNALAQQAGTVISAVMFGALVGSGRLPLLRSVCEAVINSGGKNSQASLQGFALGYSQVEGASQARVTAGAHATVQSNTRSQTGSQTRAGALPDDSAGTNTNGATRTASLSELMSLGTQRLTEFQDQAYADRYRQLIQTLANAEQKAGATADDLPVSRTAARFLALWMAYEDVIRVADLKTRPERFERIAREMNAKAGQPLVVRDFLKPGVPEIAAILPPALANWMLRRAEQGGFGWLGKGQRLRSNGIIGNLLLRMLAWLRPLRRRSSRFLFEQQAIDRWHNALLAALPQDRTLALEIAELPRVLKGYGETHERGRRSFDSIFTSLVQPVLHTTSPSGIPPAERARQIRQAREAALADPEGRTLARSLGLPLPPLKAQPIRFVPAARNARPQASTQFQASTQLKDSR